MAEPLPTFSESWYRIATLRVHLRPDVIVRRQLYRGERWIVLQNPFSSRYFRLRPAAYEFVARLRPARTVQEVWQECVARFPDDAPGQEAVIRLLSELYYANLLHYEQADSAQLFERHKQGRQRQIAARLLNLMFMRFPLLDPDQFLVRTMPVVGKFVSRFGAVLWFVVVGFAVKVVIDNFPALRVQGQGVLAPGNLALLYVALVFIKTIHEFGHAYFCRKFGGEVHVMGVLLMIFTPVPYMDASSSWGLRSRWQRVLVGAAGMIVELFVAALAAFVWAKTAPGTLHSLAYNVMFIASVSTLIFNLNPLLRFDGYYILSDLLEIPNLAQRSSGQLRHLWERYVFGVRASESPADTASESVWLVVYGITSGIYRVVVFAGVLLLVADRFLILGILMALICAVSWVTVPVGKFIYYLAASPRLGRVRLRATAISAALLAVLLVLLAVVPFPYHFRAPGVVMAQQRTEVVNDVAGIVQKMLAVPGTKVSSGQPLLQFTNEELELDLKDVSARLAESDARLRQALSRTNADLKPLQSRFVSVTNRFAKLSADRAALTVRARHDGIWVAPRIEDILGRRLARGTALGLIVDSRSFEFVATVLQTDADAAFARGSSVAPSSFKPESRAEPMARTNLASLVQPGASHNEAPSSSNPAQVRLHGQADSVVGVTRWSVVPGGKQKLPSPALGWVAGGEIPVSPNEPDKATELFFEVHADLAATPGVAMFHGRSGSIRFALPSEPLLPRWFRRLGQLLQKRYQL
jgi:putative peptide zinc metalloprotease protein